MDKTTTEVAEMLELLATNGYTLNHLAKLIRSLEEVLEETTTCEQFKETRKQPKQHIVGFGLMP